MATTHSTSTSSSNFLADLLDSLPYGVIAYEAVRGVDGEILDYRVVYYNPQVLPLIGYTAEQLNEQFMFQRSPYTRVGYESMRRIVENREPYTSEYFHPILNRWFSIINQPLGDGFYAIFRDITDIRQTQEQLEKQNVALQKAIDHSTQQQLLLRSVINASPGSITVERAIRNSAGEVVDFQAVLVNQAALTLGGHEQEEVLTKPISEINPEFISSGLLAAYRTVVETGEPFQVEFYYSPRQKHLDLSVTRMDADHIIALFTDVTQARVDAQAIRRQSELFEGVLRTSENSIIVYEAVRNKAGELIDFRVVLNNDASLRMSGRTRAEMSGITLTALYPDTKQTGLWEPYLRVYETGETFRGNQYYPGLDKWFDVAIGKLGDGLVATFIDITLAKAASQQIEEQANLFSSMLQNITNGLSVLEAIRDETGAVVDLRYLRVSQTVLDHTGLTEAQMLSNTMLTLFPGVKQTTYWRAYLHVLSTSELQHFEEHYTYDGFDNYTDNWVTRLDENRLISVYMVINEHKQAMQAVEQQAERMQNILNGAINGILFIEIDPADDTAEFIIRSANQASATILGLTLDDLTDRPMAQVLPAYRAMGFHDLYMNALRLGRPQRAELDYHDVNGLTGCFDVSAVKQNGNGVVATFINITEQKNGQRRQEQLLQALQRSNASLEQFAYVASHDLQEPLRKVKSFGDLLLDQYSDNLPADGQDIVRRMQSGSERMSILIRDLLTYSRLSMQQEDLQPVSLGSLLADIANDLEMPIHEKQARLSIGPLPTINGNPLQLRQLFQNLLSNALKFSRTDVLPTITILARKVSPAQVPVNVPDRSQQSWVAIEVTDNGIGFDPRYQDRIFQLFERLHGRSEYNGTGIGLAVCHKVAENHGGTITAQSEPGEGATFTVFLPESS